MYQSVHDRQIQAMQLENEAKRLFIQSDIERNKARNELKKENRAAAKIFAENAVRYSHQATFLLQNAYALHGYNANAKQIQNQVGMINSLNKATTHFQKTASQISLSKISKEHTKKEEILQKVSDAHDILTQSQSQEYVSVQAESLLASLNNEVMGEPALNIPIMQLSPNLVSCQDSFDNQSLNSYSNSNLSTPEMLTNAPLYNPNYNINSNNHQNSNTNTNQNLYDISSFNSNQNIYCSQSINDTGLNSTSDTYGSSSASSLNSSSNIYPCASISVNSNIYGNATSNNLNTATNINMNSNPIINGSQIMNPNSCPNPQINTTTNIYGSSTEKSDQNIYQNTINNSNGNLNGYTKQNMYPNLSDFEDEKPKRSIKYSKFGRLRNSSANIMKV